MRRRGSVRKLGNGRYQATVALGRRADGKLRRHYKTFDTEREAEDWIVTESLSMGASHVEGVTLRSAWDAYRRDRGPKLATKTLSGYDWYMHGMWSPLLDKDVTRLDLGEVQSIMLSSTRQMASHGRTALSSVLTWCVSVGLLDANPMVGRRFELPDEQDFGVWDDDPFAAIEESREVWDAITAMRCLALIRDLPLEPAWLSCIGAGMRVEEALALRGMDLRRVVIRVNGEDVGVTQAAVHRARTNLNETKATKTRQSVRIAPYLEPFGERMWEIASSVERDELVCPVSAANQNKRWRNYFAEPSGSKHAPRKDGYNYRGRLRELPYIPLSKMRRSHETLLQEAGVLDSLNAALHGHSERVSYRHYQMGDATAATVEVSERLRGIS